MRIDERRARALFFAGNALVALLVSALLLIVLGVGLGGAPALGRALVPGHGDWRTAARTVGSRTRP